MFPPLYFLTLWLCRTIGGVYKRHIVALVGVGMCAVVACFRSDQQVQYRHIAIGFFVCIDSMNSLILVDKHMLLYHLLYTLHVLFCDVYICLLFFNFTLSILYQFLPGNTKLPNKRNTQNWITFVWTRSSYADTHWCSNMLSETKELHLCGERSVLIQVECEEKYALNSGFHWCFPDKQMPCPKKQSTQPIIV